VLHLSISIHHQIAAFMQTRRLDHQRGDHPVFLLRVLVLHKVASLSVYQQLVQHALQRNTLIAQSVRYHHCHLVHTALPLRVLERHLVGCQLPALADALVHLGVHVVAERRLLALGDELLGPLLPQRHRDGPHSINDESGNCWQLFGLTSEGEISRVFTCSSQYVTDLEACSPRRSRDVIQATFATERSLLAPKVLVQVGFLVGQVNSLFVDGHNGNSSDGVGLALFGGDSRMRRRSHFIN